MQPTKHMDPSENELIAHIKDSLVSHEEPYVPGAWEKFKTQGEKKKPLIFWLAPLGSAAAVLLIATGLYLFINKTSDKPVARIAKTSPYKYSSPKPEETTTQAKAPKEIPSVSRAGQVKSVVTPPSGTKASLNTNNYTAKNTNVSVPQPKSRVGVVTKIDPVFPVTGRAKLNPVVPADAVVTNKPVIASAKEPREKNTYSFQEFLNKESAVGKESNPVAAAVIKEDKWEMGVVVAPSFGNTKHLNMGYGISMGYALSEKISLGSGISYNELAASRDVAVPSGMMSAPSKMSIAAGTEKNLESVEAKVVGIDIPFELKYHFSKSLYANVGVSAFAVLNQKQSNSYVAQKLVERPESALIAGNKGSFTTFLVAEKTTEKAPASEISDDKYLGFYNFSFGYKQKISKSKSISVEPFMKVPMKEVSKENLRLMGTGVRLKFDF